LLARSSRRDAIADGFYHAIELGPRFAQMHIVTRVAPRFGDQCALIVSRGIETEVSKRTSQPIGKGKGIVTKATISLEQRSNDHLHIDHVLLV
jgi:hypothetical protein